MHIHLRLYFFMALLFSAIFTAVPCSAEKVTSTEARDVAVRFFNNGSVSRASASSLTLTWDSSDLVSGPQATSSDPLFYVFESSSGNGYIIVAGDDVVSPVLAYSFSGPAPEVDRLPDNLKQWLTGLSSGIRQLRSRNVTASPDVVRRWKGLAPGRSVLQLETANWNQEEPYNNDCPMDGSRRSVTGCTATATAIVMRYHRYPARSTGFSEAYTGQQYQIYVPSRDLNHAINWDQLPLNYDNGYSAEQAAEVARLMADIGALYGCDYSADGTGAALRVEPLFEHYNYSRNMRMVEKEIYSSEQWKQMIKDELVNGPLLYSGVNVENGGHAFVLDGYTDNDYFHFNFGWGGYTNGYFLVDPLGNGDDAELLEFYRYQSFAMNFKPDDGSAVIDNWLQLYGEGLVADTENFVIGQRFSIPVLQISNTSTTDFSGNYKIAQVDALGNERHIHYNERNFGPVSLPTGMISTFRNLKIQLPEGTQDGDRICMFYRPDGSDEWFQMTSFQPSKPNEIIIRLPDQPVDLEGTTSMHYDVDTDVLTIKHLSGVQASLLCDGATVTDGVETIDTEMKIRLSRLDPSKRYTVSLKKGSTVRDLVLNIKNL